MPDGDQTIVQTSQFDRRTDTLNQHPVWEKVITATFDDDDTTDATLEVSMNGIIRHVTFFVPQSTNSVTKQLQILDNGNNVVFDTGELTHVAGPQTYNFSIDEPLSGSVDVVVGVSGVLGGSGIAMVATLRGI